MSWNNIIPAWLLAPRVFMPGAGVAIWRESALLNVPWWVAIDPPPKRTEAMRNRGNESLQSFERYSRSRRYYFDIDQCEYHGRRSSRPIKKSGPFRGAAVIKRQA